MFQPLALPCLAWVALHGKHATKGGQHVPPKARVCHAWRRRVQLALLPGRHGAAAVVTRYGRGWLDLGGGTVRRWRQGGRQVDAWEVCKHVLYCLVLRVRGLQGGRREVQSEHWMSEPPGMSDVMAFRSRDPVRMLFTSVFQAAPRAFASLSLCVSESLSL